MKNSRRSFIKSTLLTGGVLSLTELKAESFVKEGALTKLTVLHTNDVHSHVDPFEENDPKYPNLGGVKRRANLINKIRQENENVLLLDAGDIFQGTPYFNLYKGELELRLMSQMKYDAATMGNHDFDNGLDGFAKVQHNAHFPFICSNYDFSNTILNGKTIPYKVFYKGDLKIGVFGVGVELDGLVGSRLYGATKYLDPIETAKKYASELKEKQKCDLVICLSHLGYRYADDKISDVKLAEQTNNIDLIIGGHTHTFLDNATEVMNNKGEVVLVNQVGWAGIRLGKVNFYFDKLSKRAIRVRKKSNDFVNV